MSERWLPVVGFEGFYEVSDLGRVRSVPRHVRGRDYPAQIIKGQISPKGYVRVKLSRDGIPQRLSVHRLVLEAFVGPCPPGHEGCHGELGPGVNVLTNVRWGTPVENNEDRRLQGTLPIGETHPAATITADVAKRIKDRLSSRPRSIDVAKEFCVPKSLVDNIRCGKTWRHL